MYCFHCGKQVAENAAHCPLCGTKLKDDAQEKDEFFDPPPAYTPPAYTPPTYTQPAYTQPSNQSNKSNGFALAGFILSFFTIFTGALGLIFSIIGLVRAKHGYNRREMAIAGIVISAIMLVVSYILIEFVIYPALFETPYLY